VNERVRRIGANEAVFRLVNEQVRAVNATVSTAAETMRIVCECGTKTCVEQFEIQPEEYARIRADATLFIVEPGHDFPETERVLAENDEYWIVQKDPGLPELIARATDPRG
jgi:hypothetical protein